MNSVFSNHQVLSQLLKQKPFLLEWLIVASSGYDCSLQEEGDSSVALFVGVSQELKRLAMPLHLSGIFPFLLQVILSCTGIMFSFMFFQQGPLLGICKPFYLRLSSCVSGSKNSLSLFLFISILLIRFSNFLFKSGREGDRKVF